MVKNCISFCIAFGEQIKLNRGMAYHITVLGQTRCKFKHKGEVRKACASERSDDSDVASGVNYGCFNFNLV